MPRNALNPTNIAIRSFIYYSSMKPIDHRDPCILDIFPTTKPVHEYFHLGRTFMESNQPELALEAFTRGCRSGCVPSMAYYYLILVTGKTMTMIHLIIPWLLEGAYDTILLAYTIFTVLYLSCFPFFSIYVVFDNYNLSVSYSYSYIETYVSQVQLFYLNYRFMNGSGIMLGNRSLRDRK